MVVIVNNVTAKNEEGDDKVIVKTAKGIEQDIKDLLRCAQPSNYFYYETTPTDCWLCRSALRTIHGELADITAQDQWKNVFYKDLNSSAVDTCLNLLSTALEKFKVCLCILEVYGSAVDITLFSSLLMTSVIPTSSWNSMAV